MVSTSLSEVHTFSIVHCEIEELLLSPPDAVAKKEYCSVEVSEAKYKAFVYAIRNHYWYQMYIGEPASVVCCLTFSDHQWNAYNYNHCVSLLPLPPGDWYC